MTIEHIHDRVLFRLTGLEMRQVMETHSMVDMIWLRFAADQSEKREGGQKAPVSPPIKICPEANGQDHLLQCRVQLWEYFREIDSANPLERQIRGEMLALGLSGEADRRTARYGR